MHRSIAVTRATIKLIRNDTLSGIATGGEHIPLRNNLYIFDDKIDRRLNIYYNFILLFFFLVCRGILNSILRGTNICILKIINSRSNMKVFVMIHGITYIIILFLNVYYVHAYEISFFFADEHLHYEKVIIII